MQAIETGTRAPGARIRGGELAAQPRIRAYAGARALKRSESEGPVESVPNRDPCVALGTAGPPWRVAKAQAHVPSVTRRNFNVGAPPRADFAA